MALPRRQQVVSRYYRRSTRSNRPWRLMPLYRRATPSGALTQAEVWVLLIALFVRAPLRVVPVT